MKHMRFTTAVPAAAGGAVAAAALWWRRHPSACPYSQRFWVDAPHPLITRARLIEALDPQPGDTVLEVGPGTGYYSLPVAERLEASGGRLVLADLQQEMLDHVLRRRPGLEAHRADATDLPLADASVDAAVLVCVLGEVPDQEAALRELHRVVRPGGRLVVGELLGDPHWVAPGALRRRATLAGWAPAGSVGPWPGRLSVFSRPAAGTGPRRR